MGWHRMLLISKVQITDYWDVQWILRELGSGKETHLSSSHSLAFNLYVSINLPPLHYSYLKYFKIQTWNILDKAGWVQGDSHSSPPFCSETLGPCRKELQVCCFPGATVFSQPLLAPFSLWLGMGGTKLKPEPTFQPQDLQPSCRAHSKFTHLLQEQGHWKGYLLTALGQMSKKENKSIYKSAKEKTCDSNGLLCNSLSVAWSCPGIISCAAESAEQPHLCIE